MEKNNIDSNSPLVSVYMPTHNRGALISKAIDSVLAQTYKNIELIVCSDGSTDETIDILEAYKNKDHRFSFVVNEKPHGACYSRNRCIELARGEFITGLDDDDEFISDRIESFIEYYNSTRMDILTATRIFKNKKDAKVGDIFEGLISSADLGSSNLVGNQIFTRTIYLKELDGFDIKFPAWQDYDMWYRLVSKYGDCYKLSKPTYIFNVDEDRPRITTGSKAHAGYKMFIDKHRESLSSSHLKNLFVQDVLNRGQKIKLFDLFKNITKVNVNIYLKEKAKSCTVLRKLHAKFSKKNSYKIN